MMLADVSGLIGELSAMIEAEFPVVPTRYVLGRLKGALAEAAACGSNGEGC